MRPSPKQTNTGLNLFSTAEDPTVATTRFWINLLRYRPLILLGGLWLGFICAAAFAYSRLMFAGVPPESRQPPPPTTSSSEVLKDPSAAVAPLPTPTPSESATPEPGPTDRPLMVEQPLVADPGETTTTIPGWSLGLIVSLCAVGCFLMARRATASPRPRKVQPNAGLKAAPKKLRRSNSPSNRPNQPITKGPIAASTGPKRLQPYSPERDQIVVPVRPTGVQATGGSVTPARPRSGEIPANPIAASTISPHAEKVVSPKVTVVPESEPHTLDWPDGSLAHSLDIRQRRSLSSFL